MILSIFQFSEIDIIASVIVFFLGRVRFRTLYYEGMIIQE